MAPSTMMASPWQSRRRGAMRVGLPLLALAGLAACFDQSTYQGGGRRDIGGQLVAIDSGASDEEDASVGLPPDPGPEEDSGSVLPPVIVDAQDEGG